ELCPPPTPAVRPLSRTSTPAWALLMALAEQLDHLGDALHAYLGAALGGIDPGQPALPVEGGQRLEKPPRLGIGVQGQGDVRCESIRLRTLRSQADLDSIAVLQPPAVS